MRTTITRFSSNAGFLEQCDVEFAPGLTCVIGGRGTCKSTLIETIRFVFDQGADHIQRLTADGGLIQKTLGNGTARVELTVSDGGDLSQLHVERERFEEPRISFDGVREYTDREVLQHIDIFSQNDLQAIAENDQMRIDLIDRAHPTLAFDLQRNRRGETQTLRDVGTRLRAVRVRISTLRQHLQPLSLLREQLQAAIASTPTLPPELEQERELYGKRARISEALNEVEKLQAEALQHLASFSEITESVRAQARRIAEQGQAEAAEAETLVGALAETLSKIDGLGNNLTELPLQLTREQLAAIFEARNARYYELRREQSHLNDTLKQQQHLQKQIKDMEAMSAELAAAESEEQRLLGMRETARDKISVIDGQIFTLRMAEVDRINNDHSDRVFLSLETGVGGEAYRQKLTGMLGGSRIRNQEDVAAEIARTFPPAVVVDMVESGTGQQLASVLNRDLAQMNRVVAHLSDHAELYDLETETPSSRLEITFYDGSEPKPVEALSGGQKATALLPLILRPLPYPLIVDQPEDDLDNSFIFNTLVQTIRSLKQQRQVIFITHNANIPVLGEADRIVVMSMSTPTRASQPVLGTVDECKHHILELLEGGKEAFLEREARYHDLIHPAV